MGPRTHRLSALGEGLAGPGVKRLRDKLQRKSRVVQCENAKDYPRLIGINIQAHTTSGFDVLVSVTPAPGLKTAQDFSLKSAVCFLRGFLRVNGFNKSMNGSQ